MLVLTLLLALPSHVEDLRADLRLDEPSNWYVGQPVACEIVIQGTTQDARVEWPELPWASILVHDTRHAIILPDRAGRFLFPAIRVVAGDQSTRTQPHHPDIQPVPTNGRDAHFLGGVGRLKIAVSAPAEPVRVGDEFLYEVHLEGPGALATAPTSAGQGWLPAPGDAARLETRETTSVVPSGRTWRFHLRPLRAGQLTLPPIVISTYNPASRRFETARAIGPTVEIVPPPDFDPGDLVTSTPTNASNAPWLAPAIGVVGLTAAVLFIALARIRKQKPHSSNAIADARAWLASPPDLATLPKEITRRVGRVLSERTDHARAWHTPNEAAAELSGHHPQLAAATHQLLTACDAALFQQHPATRNDLAEAFAAWLDRVEKLRTPPRNPHDPTSVPRS